MAVDLDLARASANLAIKLKDEPMFLHIGIDERNIIAYVACGIARARGFVPPSFEGYPVLVRKSTRPRPVSKKVIFPRSR